MPVSIRCPNASCGKLLKLSDEMAAKPRGACPSCHTPFLPSQSVAHGAGQPTRSLPPAESRANRANEATHSLIRPESPAPPDAAATWSIGENASTAAPSQTKAAPIAPGKVALPPGVPPQVGRFIIE